MIAGALILLFCSWIYIQIRELPENEFATVDERQIIVEGTLVLKEYKNEQWVLYLKNCHLQNHIDTDRQDESITQKKISTGLLCYILQPESQKAPAIGSQLIVTGKLTLYQNSGNPGEFNPKLYYESLGYEGQIYQGEIITSTPALLPFGEILYQIKQYLLQQFPKVMSLQHAGFLNAMVLGEKTELSMEQKEMFQRNGISHILSISGLHISLLSWIFTTLLGSFPFSKGKITVLASVILLFYGCLTGLSVSTVRALLMFLIQTIGILIKRSYDQKTALSFTSMIILLRNPLMITNIGFQLSFLAMAGISFTPSFKKGKKKICHHLLQSFSQSFMIMIFSIPVLAAWFYEITTYSIFLNLLIIPLTTLVLYLALPCLLLTCIHPILGQIPGWILEGILSFQDYLCSLFDRLPFRSFICGNIPEWKIVLYYLLLLLFVTIPWNRLQWKNTLRVSYFIINMLFLLIPWQKKLPFYQPPAITMLDVGQGESLLFQSFAGNAFLVDGGSLSEAEVGKRILIPACKYYGINQLKVIFITHVDMDHISGICEMIELQTESGIKIENIALPYLEEPDEQYQILIEKIEEAGIGIVYLRKGDRIGDGEILFEVLYPKGVEVLQNRNDLSLVMEVQIGFFRGLLTGDISTLVEPEITKEITEKNLNFHFMKAAHHGSDYSNSDYFIEQVKPELVLISADRINQYGHPGKRFLNTLRQEKITYGFTGNSGAISITIWEKMKEFSVETYTKD